jgi:hypothetical protein
MTTQDSTPEIDQDMLNKIFDQCEALKKLENAPATLEDAIQRIMQLETVLDDLARASEIAQYSKQYDRANTYIREAEEILQNRIREPEIEQGDFKFTMVEGTMTDETRAAITERANEQAKGNA